MYQFLISTINIKEGYGVDIVKDSKGNPTAYFIWLINSHLLGLFNRTIMLLNHGIKPIWVFDGKPPEMKKEELKRRRDLKEKAVEQKKEAEEEGKLGEAKSLAGRSVHVSQEMSDDAKKLIKLMGLPVVESASEAEAQCSALVKTGKAYGTATEDMDALTFGSTHLIRGFNSTKDPVVDIDLAIVLKEFGMTMDQFIDLCILCGCDYTPHIEGIGPVTAFKLIQEHKTLEKVMEKITADSAKGKKYKVPPSFDYVEARRLFKTPIIHDPTTIDVFLTISM